ncbi:MAG: VWA domain-containing protein [Deltaproteobacteria bacterium]|nr:VWA domain-containing protein [Deltaproteobacteria bacterium]
MANHVTLPDRGVHRLQDAVGIRKFRLLISKVLWNRPGVLALNYLANWSFLRIHCLFCVLAMSLPVFPSVSNAGGILHLFPPTVNGESVAVARPAVLHSRTLLTVSESTRDYRIDQTFFNNNEFALEGLFVLPIDLGPALLNVDVSINGVSAPFSLVSGADFFPVLQELSIAMKDPSMLVLAGKNVLLVRPVQIGAQRQKSFRIQFRRPNNIDKDQLELMIPLDGERFSLWPVTGFEILVRFKMNRPLRTVLSPTHHVSILREAEHRCLVSVKSEEKRITDDFRLLTTFSGRDLDLRLFTHRQPNRKGAFLAFVIPPTPDSKQTQPYKDVVFVLDRSGSMGQSDLELGERATIEGLERLRPQDRFNVLTMGTATGRMRSQLVTATDESISEAVRFVNSLPVGGGTDLYNCLLIALEQLTSHKRPGFIVVTGDGRSTVGITNPATIVDDVRRNNRNAARIFALALGDRADTAVLDNIAESTKGSCLNLSRKDDFDSVVNRLFEGISPPQVSELSLGFQDITPEEVIPDPIVDVLGQEGVIVVGRYDNKNDASSKVRLSGKIKGHERTFTKTFEFPLIDMSKPYISEIWAMRKIARLFERQRIKGPEPDTSEQIATLADQFGFRTMPFVSSVAQEWGSLYWRFKTSVVPSDVQSDRFRRVNGKTFRLENGVWVDTEYRSWMESRIIPFLSPAYFDLLKDKPSIGPYLGLGPDVGLVLDQGPVRITGEEP